MSRASRRDNSISSSLFPFLAVLLCTMGVLVVLLMVMASVQINQANARQQQVLALRKAAKESPEQERLRAEMASLEEQQRQLDEAQQQARDRLSNEQQRLSQVEENLRRRQEKLALLRLQIEELQALGGDSQDDLQQARASLDKQRELLAKEREEIEKLKQEHKGRQQYYAILPYEGSGGTRRKPIYIECRNDVVVFQPAGIELTAEDFNQALGSGGPLPSAVRAAQRYYADHGVTGTEQAYPLIIARPDSAATFFRVLSSVADSSIDFGYEVVDADWEFDFSAVDPAVSEEMSRAIFNARQRLAALREQAPGTFADNHLDSFDAGPGLLERVRRGQLPPGYTSIGGANASMAGPPSVLLSRNSVDMGRLAAALSSAAAPEGANSGGGPSTVDISALGEPANRSSAMPGQGGRMGLGPASRQSPGGDALTSDSSQREALGAVATNAAQQVAGSPSAAVQPSSSADSSVANAPAGSPGGAASGSAGNAASQMATAGMSDEQLSAAGPARKKESNQAGVALVRTLHVRVAPEQLVVKSGKRPTVGDHRIPLGNDINQAATLFVKAVQAEVQAWGIAGDGLYWRPVMEIDVEPGAEQLAQRLASVLRQGGLEVRVAKLP